MAGSDLGGLAMTAATPAAVNAYNNTIMAYLGFRRDTGPVARTMFEADPDMPMGHCLMGYFYHLMGMPALAARAEKSLGRAAAAAQTDRERGHVAALAAWCAGDFHGAVDQFEAILLDAPRDILAIKLVNFLHFYLGDSRQMRDSVLRVLPAWRPDEAVQGYLLSLAAFGHEECGDYARGEAVGRAAVERNPGDVWGVHAVAHVMEMQDRRAEGAAWVESLAPHWLQANNFRYHLVWHGALIDLELGAHNAVLERYDNSLFDPDSDEYLDLCNDAALLARLHWAGVDVGDRWQNLAAKVRNRANDHIFCFADAHYLLALAYAGEIDAARAMIQSMRADAGAHAETRTNAAVAGRAGVALCEAILAYREGRFADTVDGLAPVRHEVSLIGGSHAQRDLFAQMLINAAMADGRHNLARGLLGERLGSRPDNVWGQRRTDELMAAMASIQ